MESRRRTRSEHLLGELAARRGNAVPPMSEPIPHRNKGPSTYTGPSLREAPRDRAIAVLPSPARVTRSKGARVLDDAWGSWDLPKRETRKLPPPSARIRAKVPEKEEPTPVPDPIDDFTKRRRTRRLSSDSATPSSLLVKTPLVQAAGPVPQTSVHAPLVTATRDLTKPLSSDVMGCPVCPVELPVPTWNPDADDQFVFVKELFGKQKRVKWSGKEIVTELKARLQAIFDVEPAQQTLLFQGTRLLETDTADMLKPGTILVLVRPLSEPPQQQFLHVRSGRGVGVVKIELPLNDYGSLTAKYITDILEMDLGENLTGQYLEWKGVKLDCELTFEQLGLKDGQVLTLRQEPGHSYDSSKKLPEFTERPANAPRGSHFLADSHSLSTDFIYCNGLLETMRSGKIRDTESSIPRRTPFKLSLPARFEAYVARPPRSAAEPP